MRSHAEPELKDSTQRLVRDLRQVVHDGEEVLRAGVDELGEKSAAARARLSDALESARETLERIQKKTIAGAKATDRAVRENPYQSMGIAFGAGILIGLLLMRRK
jgi:ElaB/YqjD/DUF883 family membrane-anchored ribosome-binding protein